MEVVVLVLLILNLVVGVVTLVVGLLIGSLVVQSLELLRQWHESQQRRVPRKKESVDKPWYTDESL